MCALTFEVSDLKTHAVLQSHTQKKKIRQLLYQKRKLPLGLVKKKQIFSMLKFNYDSSTSNKESLKLKLMIDRKVKKIVRYLPFYDYFLLVLMKLKLKLYNKDFAFRFKQWQFLEYFGVGCQFSQNICSI